MTKKLLLNRVVATLALPVAVIKTELEYYAEFLKVLINPSEHIDGKVLVNLGITLLILFTMWCVLPLFVLGHYWYVVTSISIYTDSPKEIFHQVLNVQN